MDFHIELKDAVESSEEDKIYELLGTGVIAIVRKVPRCLGAFFRPSFISKVADGIHDLTFQSIMELSVPMIRCAQRSPGFSVEVLDATQYLEVINAIY